MKYLNFILAFQLLFLPSLKAQRKEGSSSEPTDFRPITEAVSFVETEKIQPLKPVMNFDFTKNIDHGGYADISAGKVRNVPTTKYPEIKNIGHQLLEKAKAKGIVSNGSASSIGTPSQVCGILKETFENYPKVSPADILEVNRFDQKNFNSYGPDRYYLQILARTIDRYTQTGHTERGIVNYSFKQKALLRGERFNENCLLIAKDILEGRVDISKQLSQGLDWELEKIDQNATSVGIYLTSSPKQEASCAALGDGSCIETDSEYNRGCNSFECTGAGKNVLGEDIGKVASAIKNFYSDGSIPRGDNEFCVECLGRSYNAVNSGDKDFIQEKNKLQEAVKDRIAGKKASQNLFRFVGALENLKDLQYTEGTSPHTEKSCISHFKNAFNWSPNTCKSSSIDKETYSKRLSLALDQAGIITKVENGGEDILEEILNKVDPTQGGNRCREALAKKKKLSLYLPENRKFLAATAEILSTSLRNDKIEKKLQVSDCSEIDESEDLTSALSSELASEIVDEMYESALDHHEFSELEDTSSRGLNKHLLEKICKSPTRFTQIMFCEKKESLFSSVFLEGAQELRKRLEEDAKEAGVDDLSKYDREDGTHSAVGMYTQTLSIKKEDYKKVFAAQFKNLLNLSKSLNPVLKSTLGSWENACETIKSGQYIKAPIANFFTGNSPLNNEEDIAEMAQKNCQLAFDRFNKSLCDDSPLLQAGDENRNLNFSENDFMGALNDLIGGDQSQEMTVLGKSLGCQVLSLEHNNRTIFNDQDKTSDASEGLHEFSDFKKDALKARGAAMPGSTIADLAQEANGCDDSIYEEILTNLSYDKKKNYLGVKDIQKMRETYDQIAQVENSQRAPAPSYFDPTGGSGSVIRFTENSSRGSRDIATVDLPGRSDAGGRSPSSISGPIEASTQTQSQDTAIGSIPTTASNAIGGPEVAERINQGPQSYFSPSEISRQVTDNDLARAISSTNKDQTAQAIMAKAGMSNDPEIKQMLKELLEGKKRDEKIAELEEQIKNDRKKHQEQIKSLEEILKEQKAAVKNEKGKVVVPETKDVKKLASNSDFVVNTRSLDKPNAPVEFVNKSYYTSGPGKASVSPGFSETSKAERVSLADYSASRRSAASARMSAAANKVNQGINTSFLQSFDTSTYSREDGTIDYGTYARNYVAHIAKNSGSIEHLVIYNAEGRPDKIRVPDPKGRDEFVEVEIPEDLKEKILQQVSKDEVESFQIYEMVNFGGSLLEILEAQKKEVKELEQSEKDLTMLSALNARLESLREL